MDTDLQRLAKEHSARLYRLAFSYLGAPSDAEDAVQETFVRYLTCGRDFDSDEHRLNWLMKVTANVCRDQLRRSARRNQQPIDTLPEPAAPARDDDTRIAVQQALFSLPSDDRGVVYLYYYEEYSVRQIAAALSLSETAVRSRLDRARKRLKKLLGGDVR